MWWGQGSSPGNLAQKFEHTTLSCATGKVMLICALGSRALVPGVESSPRPSRGLVGL